MPDEGGSFDDEVLGRVVSFHGHLCPGLAMGVQAARIALREIGPSAQDEEVVAVVETDMCGVDGIQFLTGCTFGKGNLVHRDYGKNAYTFFRRSDGRAVRIAGRPRAWAPKPEHEELFDRLGSGEASAADAARFRELHEARAMALLALDPDDLFNITEVHEQPPHLARVFDSVPCARCAEDVMETRVRRLGGRELCQPCFEEVLADD